jgi:polygalacturonase
MDLGTPPEPGGESFGSQILEKLHNKNILMKILNSIIITIILLATISLSARDFNASLFGIRSDGTTNNTGSIRKAIDYINENGGGVLVFYVGRYLTGTVQLKSNVSIRLEEGAILVGSASIYDYSGLNGNKALLVADGEQNIGISGKGVIEGQGEKLLEQINQQFQKGYLQEKVTRAWPALILMNNCSHIAMEGINLVNGCSNAQVYKGCKVLSISGVTTRSTVSLNSGGILLSGCDSVIIRDSFFDTSGKEILIDGISKNISVIDCVNANGKKF